jgi:hypothetical protein
MERVLLTVVPYHRAVLVAATIGIAIAGGRVAGDPGEVGGWLVLTGSTALLALADVCSDLNKRAEVLAASAGVERRAALKDLYAAESQRKAYWLLPVGAVLLLAAALIYALGG